MALSRVKTWSSGEILTASDLNSEFNNILNNALTLISPLTANLDFDGFDAVDIDDILNVDGIIRGTSTAVTAGSAHPWQVLGTSAATTGLVAGMFSADTVAPTIAFAKSRHATIGSHTIVVNGDELGVITAYGSDGTNFEPAAQIKFTCSSTPGNNDMPGTIHFLTTADGAATLTSRMTISSNGSLVSTGLVDNRYVTFQNAGTVSPGGIEISFSAAAPDNNTSYFLYGRDSSADRFFIYSDGDLQNSDNSYGGISDERLKQDIVDARSQWEDMKNLRVRKYRFKADVEANKNAVAHIGVIAQEVLQISPGLVTHDEARDSYGVQYSILYMKAVKCLQEAMERIEKLEEKVNAA